MTARTEEGIYHVPPVLYRRFITQPRAPPALPRDSRPGDARDESAAEQGDWESIRQSADPQAFKTHLGRYPRGQFRGEARARLGELLGEDYATLFAERAVVNGAWSQVEKVLMRRADLIPVLIATLQNAGVQELEVYGRIADARARLLNAIHSAPDGESGLETPERRREVIEADGSFGEAVGRLRTLPEVYPQLRSNELYVRVMDEWAGVENRINVAREDYNGAAEGYNAARRRTREAGAAERLGFREEPTFNGGEARPAEPKIKAVPPA
jgi:LemA protein